MNPDPLGNRKGSRSARYKRNLSKGRASKSPKTVRRGSADGKAAAGAVALFVAAVPEVVMHPFRSWSAWLLVAILLGLAAAFIKWNMRAVSISLAALATVAVIVTLAVPSPQERSRDAARKAGCVGGDSVFTELLNAVGASIRSDGARVAQHAQFSSEGWSEAVRNAAMVARATSTLAPNDPVEVHVNNIYVAILTMQQRQSYISYDGQNLVRQLAVDLMGLGHACTTFGFGKPVKAPPATVATVCADATRAHAEVARFNIADDRNWVRLSPFMVAVLRDATAASVSSSEIAQLALSWVDNIDSLAMDDTAAEATDARIADASWTRLTSECERVGAGRSSRRE